MLILLALLTLSDAAGTHAVDCIPMGPASLATERKGSWSRSEAAVRLGCVCGGHSRRDCGKNTTLSDMITDKGGVVAQLRCGSGQDVEHTRMSFRLDYATAITSPTSNEQLLLQAGCRSSMTQNQSASSARNDAWFDIVLSAPWTRAPIPDDPFPYLVARVERPQQFEELYRNSFPGSDVAQAIARGVAQSRRILDSNSAQAKGEALVPPSDDVLSKLASRSSPAKGTLPIRHFRQGGACWLRLEAPAEASKLDEVQSSRKDSKHGLGHPEPMLSVGRIRLHHPPLLHKSRGISIRRSPPDASGKWLLVAPRQCPHRTKHHHPSESKAKTKQGKPAAAASPWERHLQSMADGPGQSGKLNRVKPAGQPKDRAELAFPEDSPGADKSQISLKSTDQHDSSPAASASLDAVQRATAQSFAHQEKATGVDAQSFVGSILGDLEESMAVLGQELYPSAARWAESEEDGGESSPQWGGATEGVHDTALLEVGSWLHDDQDFVALQGAWRESGGTHIDWAGAVHATAKQSATSAESRKSSSEPAPPVLLQERIGVDGMPSTTGSHHEKLHPVARGSSDLEDHVDWLLEIVQKVSSGSKPGDNSRNSSGRNTLTPGGALMAALLEHDAPSGDVAASAIVSTEGDVALSGVAVRHSAARGGNQAGIDGFHSAHDVSATLRGSTRPELRHQGGSIRSSRQLKSRPAGRSDVSNASERPEGASKVLHQGAFTGWDEGLAEVWRQATALGVGSRAGSSPMLGAVARAIREPPGESSNGNGALLREAPWVPSTPAGREAVLRAQAEASILSHGAVESSAESASGVARTRSRGRLGRAAALVHGVGPAASLLQRGASTRSSQHESSKQHNEHETAVTLAHALFLQLHSDTDSAGKSASLSKLRSKLSTVNGSEAGNGRPDEEQHVVNGEIVLSWLKEQRDQRGSGTWRHPTEHALSVAHEGDPHKAMALLSVQTDASVAGLLGVGTSSREAFACIVDMIMAVAPEIILQILVNVVRQPFADIMSLIMPLIIPPIMVPNSGSVPLTAPGPDVAMFPKQAGPPPKKAPPCSCPREPIGNPALSGPKSQRFAGVRTGVDASGAPCACDQGPEAATGSHPSIGVDGTVGSSQSDEEVAYPAEVYEYTEPSRHSGSLPATLLQSGASSLVASAASSSSKAGTKSGAGSNSGSSAGSRAGMPPEAGDPIADIETRVVDEITQSLKGGALLNAARVAADRLEQLLPAAAAAGVTRSVLRTAVPRAVQRLVSAVLPALTSRLALSLTRQISRQLLLELGPGLVEKLGLSISRSLSHNPTTDYYCSQCNEERQVDGAEESPLTLPPYCEDCLRAQRQAADTDERVLAAVRSAWQPTVARLLEGPVLDAVAARALREGLAEVGEILEETAEGGKGG